MPVAPANSSMLIGSSLRFCRDRELALIQLSLEMAQQLVGDETVIFDRLAFRIEVGKKLSRAGRFGNRRIRPDGREQGNVVLARKRLEAIQNYISHLKASIDLHRE